MDRIVGGKHQIQRKYPFCLFGGFHSKNETREYPKKKKKKSTAKDQANTVRKTT